ncbi:MAG: alpha-galactosidase [Caulobacter sp.]|nr:alpha-galactosidase [Caulobacter sp.]
MRFDPQGVAFFGRAVRLAAIAPLLDGAPVPVAERQVSADAIVWRLGGDLAGARMTLAIAQADEGLRLELSLEGLAPNRPVDSLGLRFAAVDGVSRYLRNGYQSWDGSFLVTPGEPLVDPAPARSPRLGFAFTALLPGQAKGVVILGFTRHDRFQSRFSFGDDPSAFTLDVETLWDRAAHDGRLAAEPLALFDGPQIEEGCRAWDRLVAQEAPQAPRRPQRRITGWCSWYSLYAAIDEAVILDHLAAAGDFRDRHQVPLDVFLVDDGFTPEMGDWLQVKPQFPRGMGPLVEDIAQAGFVPGLWIAPFMVGNRSRLFAEHPDWVVRERATGEPLTHMRFYGEFRWHKRSEEYYPLDITHPDAEAYIRKVFRTWRAWGVGYFKTDFMSCGAEYGPDRAVWHEPGLSRIAIWRRMANLIREEIGEALWLGCGCPLWAGVGLVDAMRIGRDIGVSWEGDYSAESLLRDQVTRNHASGLLWQADPDCILLRDRFHDLDDEQVRSLAAFAGLSGGVLMTSDKLDELSPPRAALLAALLRQTDLTCAFPQLADQHQDGVITQKVSWPDGRSATNLFNTRGGEARRDGFVLPPYGSRLIGGPDDLL